MIEVKSRFLPSILREGRRRLRRVLVRLREFRSNATGEQWSPGPMALPERPLGLPATLPGNRPWPKITIVTPSFNQGTFIEETIQSVLDQGYPNLEYIIVDGGSTDSTIGTLDAYRDRVTRIISEPDRGQSHAINKGFALATGSILHWLNSDDRLAPGALAAVAMAFHTSGADVVSGICELYRDGALVGRHMSACADSVLPLDDLLDLDGGWNAGQFFYQPEVFFTRDLWQRAGGRVEENLHFSMDYELWLRFAMAGAKLHRIGRPLARFRIHPAQKTADQTFLEELRVVRNDFVAKNSLRPGASVRGRPNFHGALRIAFVNDLGFKYGAGIAHERIAAGFEMAGHDVRAFSIEEAGESKVERELSRFAPDVVLFGNLHGTSTPVSFVSRIAARWHSFWVLHDFWLLTGRCAYTGGCERYRTGCNEECPTSEQYPSLAPEKIGAAWESKRSVLEDGSVTLLANSAWTREFASEYVDSLRGTNPARVEQISLGLPTKLFKPVDRSAARSFFGISESTFLIVFSASSLSDERKGAGTLAEAFRLVQDLNIALLVIGRLDIEFDVGSIPVHSTGYLSGRDRVVLALNAADLLVGASSAETFGQVFAEAAACGVPSVAFHVTGVKDAVIDGITGLAVERRSAEALAEEVRVAVAAKGGLLDDLAAWGRIYAENEWSLEAGYGTVFAALRRHPSFESFGIPHRIHFSRPASIEVPGHATTTWVPMAGISGLEGPYLPDHPVPFHWCHGETSELRLIAPHRGRVRIAIEYRNILFDNIPCEVSIGGRHVHSTNLERTAPQKTGVIGVEVSLEDGVGELGFKFGERIVPTEVEPRALTIMLIGLTVSPMNESGGVAVDSRTGTPGG